jgi:hypothetical protein
VYKSYEQIGCSPIPSRTIRHWKEKLKAANTQARADLVEKLKKGIFQLKSLDEEQLVHSGKFVYIHD